MKIDAKIVSDHLAMVAMNKRVNEAVLGPNFSAQVVDESEEVMLRATVGGVKFPGKFGVERVSDLARILESFDGEVDAELEREGGKDGLEKLVLSAGDVTVWYQTADADKITTTLTSFAAADEAIVGDAVLEVTPGEGFIKDFAQYQKRIAPDLIEVAVRGKKLVMRLMNATTRHRAEVVVGDAPTTSKRKFNGLKLGAAVVADVLAGVKPTEGDQLRISVGKALRVEFRTYTYLVSPRVEAVE